MWPTQAWVNYHLTWTRSWISRSWMLSATLWCQSLPACRIWVWPHSDWKASAAYLCRVTTQSAQHVRCGAIIVTTAQFLVSRPFSLSVKYLNTVASVGVLFQMSTMTTPCKKHVKHVTRYSRYVVNHTKTYTYIDIYLFHFIYCYYNQEYTLYIHTSTYIHTHTLYLHLKKYSIN